MYESRQKTIDAIRDPKRPIQKMMLATAVELDPARISDYLKHRPLSEERCKKIEETVAAIVKVWDTFRPFRIILDSPELVRDAVASAETQINNQGISQAAQSLHAMLEELKLTRNYVEAKEQLAAAEAQVKDVLKEFATQ